MSVTVWWALAYRAAGLLLVLALAVATLHGQRRQDPPDPRAAEAGVQPALKQDLAPLRKQLEALEARLAEIAQQDASGQSTLSTRVEALENQGSAGLGLGPVVFFVVLTILVIAFGWISMWMWDQIRDVEHRFACEFDGLLKRVVGLVAEVNQGREQVESISVNLRQIASRGVSASLEVVEPQRVLLSKEGYPRIQYEQTGAPMPPPPPIVEDPRRRVPTPTCYAEMPDPEGGFPLDRLVRAMDSRSLYEIENANASVGVEVPLRLSRNPDAHQVAMSNHKVFLFPVCYYEDVPSSDHTRIQTLQEGVARLEPGRWRVITKIHVKFT